MKRTVDRQRSRAIRVMRREVRQLRESWVREMGDATNGRGIWSWVDKLEEQYLVAKSRLRDLEGAR